LLARRVLQYATPRGCAAAENWDQKNDVDFNGYIKLFIIYVLAH